MPLRSRSARSEPRTSWRAKRCWMPALATTAIRAPASACATDARLPKALRFRPWRRAGWSGRCGCGTSALAAPEARGHGAVILLGDAPYYARFGFSGLKTAELSLPGPFERDRLLGLELRDGALDGAWGMIAPTGASASPTKARRTKLLRPVPQAA